MDTIVALLKKWFLFGVMGIVCLLVVVAAIKKHNYENQILELQNKLAESSKTVEDQKGLFEKLTVQTGDLKSLLNSKDQQIQELNNQVKQDKDQLLTATTAVASWKKAYEGLANAQQTNVPPTSPGGKDRERVDFNKDFGYIGASGYTLTNPAEAYVKVQQNRPLKLTVAVAQNKDKSWKTYVTSSEDNVGVDVAVSGVNPAVLEYKWYEGIELQSQLGAGTSGALLGIGVGVRISRFTVGPNVWAVSNGKLSEFYGMNLAWRPFER